MLDTLFMVYFTEIMLEFLSCKMLSYLYFTWRDVRYTIYGVLHRNNT